MPWQRNWSSRSPEAFLNAKEEMCGTHFAARIIRTKMPEQCDFFGKFGKESIGIDRCSLLPVVRSLLLKHGIEFPNKMNFRLVYYGRGTNF